MELSNFRPSNRRTIQDAKKNCDKTNLSDVNISGNSLDKLLNSKCSLHLAAFIVRNHSEMENLEKGYTAFPKREYKIPRLCLPFLAQVTIASLDWPETESSSCSGILAWCGLIYLLG